MWKQFAIGLVAGLVLETVSGWLHVGFWPLFGIYVFGLGLGVSIGTSSR